MGTFFEFLLDFLIGIFVPEGRSKGAKWALWIWVGLAVALLLLLFGLEYLL